MNRNLIIGLLLVLTIALGLRLPHLGERPMHTDESVHAYKFLGLLQGEGYRYNPHEYHGPTLYYASLPFAWLRGTTNSATLNETTLRLVPLAFGVGLILLLPLLGDGLSRGAVWWAALFTAVSPAFVFFSRYYIHELLLVFFTLLLLAAVWRYLRTRHAGWAFAAGAAVGLMQATKETFVFNLAAAGAGLGLTFAWGRWREGTLWWPEGRWNRRHALLALAGLTGVSVLLFSSFFTNARGPLDSLLTYQPWFSRAGGNSPHLHPWSFYLERLFWFQQGTGPRFSELLVAGFALVAFLAALAGKSPSGADRRLIRFLGFYTVCLAAVYTVIPYKTPWCALNFHHGAVLLAGAGVMVVIECLRSRWLAALAALAVIAGALQLGGQAWRASVPLAADRRNPWVYAHTSVDFLRLIDQVKAIANARFNPAATEIKAIGRHGDYWPLPWYLRGFKPGFYAEIPPDPWAPMIIASSKFDADLDERSEKKWLMVGLFEHRPNVFFELYVEFELWKRYLETRPRPPEDDDEEE